MYHKSYFLYDGCYGISSDRKVLSSKYVMNLDRSSDYLGFQLSLLLHLDLSMVLGHHSQLHWS